MGYGKLSVKLPPRWSKSTKPTSSKTEELLNRLADRYSTLIDDKDNTVVDQFVGQYGELNEIGMDKKENKMYTKAGLDLLDDD